MKLYKCQMVYTVQNTGSILHDHRRTLHMVQKYDTTLG